MQSATVTLGGERATVTFCSRYRGTNEYEIELWRGGARVYGRVSEDDSGAVRTRSEHFTDADAVLAVAAFDAMQREQYVAARARRPDIYTVSYDEARLIGK